MSFVSGERLDTLLARRLPQELRDTIGARLVELFYFQILRLGAFHADPHWGNYLFRADGIIGVVDFGCVKVMRPEFVEHWRELFLYPGSRDTPTFRKLIRDRYAAVGQKLTAETAKALIGLSERFYRKIYPPEPEADARPVDFGNAGMFKDYMRDSGELSASNGVLAEYIFYARAEIGLYHTLHRLGARVRMSAIVRKYVDPKRV